MDSAIIKALDRETASRVYKSPAKRVLEKLDPLASHVESYQKRWFWELLQNACDYNDKVIVELEITSDFLYFRHNGSPFTLSQAINLILPDSDKDQDKNPEVIGQYGSGFISTHILSTHITVTGTLQGEKDDQHPFEFLLDRSAHDNRDVLAGRSQQAEAQFKTSLGKAVIPDKPFTTQFKYDLGKAFSFVNASKTVEMGVSFVEEILPYVFAFQRRLFQVTLKRGEKTSIYDCSYRSDNKVVTRVIDFESDKPVATNEFTIRIFSEQDTFVAAEEENGSIIAFQDDLPKLFKVYPMIGAHDFPFPCVIHSLSLVPVSERYGIRLSANDKANRTVIQNATIAYGRMISTLAEDEGLKTVYNICSVSTGSFSGDVQTWFKDQVYSNLRDKLLTSKIIPIRGEKRETLKSSLIPVIEKERFKEYLEVLKETTLPIPVEDECEQWEAAINFAIFPDQQLTLKNLLEYFSKSKRAVGTFLIVPDNTFEWISKFLSLIINAEQKSLLTAFSIVPQQDDKLRVLSADLYWDDSIPTELKDILELISTNSFRQILMHKAVEKVGPRLLESKKQKTAGDILDAIDKALQKVQLKDANYLDALRRILKWTDKFQDDELRVKMPWFAAERAPLVMRALASDANRDMAFKIIQSGKIDVLSKLADENVSKERLEILVQLSKPGVPINSLMELLDIANDVPMNKIVDSAKELKVQAVDRDFKNKQGSSIEKLVEVVLNEDLPVEQYSCKHLGAGAYDFVITHLSSGRQAYLEIKSHSYGSKDPSKMYVSQAKMAVNCIKEDNYILGVISRPDTVGGDVTQYIRENMRFTFGIGTKLSAAVTQYINLEPFHVQRDGVSIEFEGKEVKFLVDREVTKEGYPFGGFKTRLRQVFERKISGT